MVTTTSLIFNFIKNNPGCVPREVAASLGVTPDKISSQMGFLARKGRLARDGEEGSFRYYIPEEKPHVEEAENNIRVVDSLNGHPSFDECRANCGNYQLTKLLRNIRAGL